MECVRCNKTIRQVPGSHGPVWVDGIGYRTCKLEDGLMTTHKPYEELLGELLRSVGNLLPSLNVSGTCQVCELSWYAHADRCPVRDILRVLDELAHMRGGD